jgi:hypothetical protein
MCFAHGTAQPVRLPRIQDQVHVVWHQAVSPNFHSAHLLPNKIAVNLLIALLKENRFSAIATLRPAFLHGEQSRMNRRDCFDFLLKLCSILLGCMELYAFASICACDGSYDHGLLSGAVWRDRAL